MKTQYNLGPGYIYALGEKPIFKNCCLLGHVTVLTKVFVSITFRFFQQRLRQARIGPPRVAVKAGSHQNKNQIELAIVP